MSRLGDRDARRQLTKETTVGGTNNKLKLLNSISGRGFWYAYRYCRKAGEYPWCSVRLAIQHGMR